MNESRQDIGSLARQMMAPQTEQILPAVLPEAVQVGSTAATSEAVWPLAEMASVRVSLHRRQV